MAILIYYRKTRDTPTEVEYSYGPQETQLTTRVVLDKAKLTGPPITGTGDPACQDVVRTVRRQQWPNDGVIQS